MKRTSGTQSQAYGAERIEQRELRRVDTAMDLTLLEIDTIEAVASDEVIYQLAAVLPVHEPGTPGRRPHYPPWVHVLHKALAGVLGSHSKAARAMAHPAYWRTIRQRAAAHNAPKPPRRAPQRWHHNYAQRLIDEHADKLLAAFRPLARRLARDLGCLDPAAPVSHTNPAVRDTSRTKEDAAIGVVFTTLFALGLVLISVTPSQVDLNHIIFGNLLGVSQSDLIQVAILGALVLAVLLYKRRDFTLYAFDPNHAHAIGLNPRLLSAAMLGLLALTAVVALQAVGVVLVVALLITPGATAYLLTDRFSRMLLIAPTIAAACALIGLYASYYLDTASGPMVVLANGATFTLAYLFSPHHGLLTTRRGPATPAADAVPTGISQHP